MKIENFQLPICNPSRTDFLQSQQNLTSLQRVSKLRDSSLDTAARRSINTAASTIGIYTTGEPPGFQAHVPGSCPGGTLENSPTFQRWVQPRHGISPEGTADKALGHSDFSRPFGTYASARPNPTLKRWAIPRCPSGTAHACVGSDLDGTPDLCRNHWASARCKKGAATVSTVWLEAPKAVIRR